MADPKKPLDLRRPKPPPPPPPAQAPQPPRGWQPPPGFLAPGQVIATDHLTPYERKKFEELGVQPGTPVPGNLSEIIRDIKGEASPEAALGLPGDFAAPDPKTVEEADLTPAQRAQVRAAIDQAAAQARQVADIPQIPGAGTGVNEAIARGTLMGMQAAQPPPITVRDDRIAGNQPPPAGAAASPPGPGRVYVHKGRVEDMPPEVARHFAVPRPPPPPEPAPEPAPGTMTDSGAGDARSCPHCGWDLAAVDGIEVSDADKYGFLWSVLGGPDKRFTRPFEMMGGRACLNFRTLTSREADLTLLQVAHDYRRGEIAGDTNWFQRWMDYRLSFALESIAVEGVGKTYVGPAALDDIEYDHPVDAEGRELPSTPYPALWRHLEENHLHNESFRRAVSLAYASFVDLTKKLESNYDNRDFWRGIGGPA